MFNFLIGGIVGLFLAMVGFSLLAIFNTKVDLAIFTNGIIAFATVVATAIHIDYRKIQRKEKIWELNKVILLDLSISLAKVIEDLKKATDYYLEVEQGIQHLTGSSYEHPSELYQEFSQKTFELINAYSAIMTTELKGHLQSFETKQENILNALDSDGISVFEAYDYSLGHHVELKEHLDDFIKDVSGIAST